MLCAVNATRVQESMVHIERGMRIMTVEKQMTTNENLLDALEQLEFSRQIVEKMQEQPEKRAVLIGILEKSLDYVLLQVSLSLEE